MTEPTQSGFDDKLARFARGEVTSEEARELAQASLDSAAWFEELTATALAKTAVSSVPVPAVLTHRAWWRSRILLATAAAVIVVGGIIAPYMLRTSQKRSEPVRTATSQNPAAGAPTPTLAFGPGSAQPILLAESLQPATPEKTRQVFRGNEEVARAPRQTGVITSVDEGQATIDLGSVDGLVKGSQVELYGDNTFKHLVGTLRLQTVFREQARVDVGQTNVKVQYAVRVMDSDHLQALLQRARDFEARGDLTSARRIATQANEWCDRATLTASQKASATEGLARLDFRAGDLAAAERHYRAALDVFTADAHSPVDDLADVQNSLAALVMLRGDYESADKLLRGNPATATRPNLRAQQLNNLGVLAEIHGDHQQAETYYGQALAILPHNLPNEKKIAEANLARVKGLH